MEVEVENDTPALEEEIRERILKEREAAEAERIARDKELEEESIQLDKEIEQEIRGQCRVLCMLAFDVFTLLQR